VKDKVTPVVLALVALALFLALESEPPVAESPRPSEDVPDFTFTHQGREQRLSELRGRVVVVNFWATWCPPCVAEMPSLERLHKQLSPRGLVVLGISVDSDATAYEKFLRDLNITFINHRDPDRHISSLYGTFMYPETYIIDAQGRLVRKVIGALEWDDPQVVSQLTSLLEQAGAPRR
jgi:peroxiredoxin